ncbi:MAG: hypothetical protein IT580_09270 [Verrucomicrobiales bacterium]|nr:hypothetical protein [Verrucomicrobiales bacterium]
MAQGEGTGTSPEAAGPNSHLRHASCSVVPSEVGPGDFTLEDGGRMVFTAAYLLRRGFCCGSGCRHCPYPDTSLKGAASEGGVHRDPELARIVKPDESRPMSAPDAPFPG